MIAIDDLHPLAREALTHFASVGFFRSDRFCQAIAEIEPNECMKWALELVSQRANKSERSGTVAATLSLIRTLIDSPDPDKLPALDALAWQCWCAGSFDADFPFLQRAVARLAWAAIGLVCLKASCSFVSERVAISADAHDDSGIGTLVHQCASAIDMTFTEMDDGRLMVAADFTRKMEALA